MADIKDFLTNDHRACDELFADMEQKASKGSLSDAKAIYETFAQATEHHFQMEEKVMFRSLSKRRGWCRYRHR